MYFKDVAAFDTTSGITTVPLSTAPATVKPNRNPDGSPCLGLVISVLGIGATETDQLKITYSKSGQASVERIIPAPVYGTRPGSAVLFTQALSVAFFGAVSVKVELVSTDPDYQPASGPLENAPTFSLTLT